MYYDYVLTLCRCWAPYTPQNIIWRLVQPTLIAIHFRLHTCRARTDIFASYYTIATVAVCFVLTCSICGRQSILLINKTLLVAWHANLSIGISSGICTALPQFSAIAVIMLRLYIASTFLSLQATLIPYRVSKAIMHITACTHPTLSLHLWLACTLQHLQTLLSMRGLGRHACDLFVAWVLKWAQRSAACYVLGRARVQQPLVLVVNHQRLVRWGHCALNLQLSGVALALGSSIQGALSLRALLVVRWIT